VPNAPPSKTSMKSKDGHKSKDSHKSKDGEKAKAQAKEKDSKAADSKSEDVGDAEKSKPAP